CPGGASLNHTTWSTHKALGPRLTLRQCLGECSEVNQVRVSRCHLFRGNGIENKDSALEEERQMITAQLGRHQTLGITQMARIRRLLRLHSLVLHGPSSSPILFHDMAAAAVIRVVVLLQRLRVLTLRCGHRLWSRRSGPEEQRRTGRFVKVVARETGGARRLHVGKWVRVSAQSYVSLARSNPPQPL
ncbi:hypothetical protein BHE74_00045014, partial [Ensete ventricosum]